MRKWVLLLSFFSMMASVQASACHIEVPVTDVIGPATLDLLQRVEKRADQEKCSSVLLKINTPGGSLETTRMLVELILNSKHAYLCLVSPAGGHAGSAGAIILQACHISGALKGTNLGAATPVTMGGEMPEDLRKKILNDTRSWLESLTKLRGRSEKFGQEIILEAKAVTAEEALRLKAIDFVGTTQQEFLDFATGREVKMPGDAKMTVEPGAGKVFELDTRYKVVSILTDPQLAYMMLLGSLALLYFEITHPGTMIAGVVGGLGLVIALVALHKLDVEWGGLALIFLGIGMLIAEMFIPSFGALGVGGIVAFVLGSIFLFDPVKTGGYRLPLQLIMPVALLFAGIFLGVGYLVLQGMKVKRKGGFEDLMGEKGKIVNLESTGLEGMVELRGELWKFVSQEPVHVDARVIVEGHDGLILKVKREV
ncbi:MAG: nodulation protein NfeD [Bdellovibrionales bacterium]